MEPARRVPCRALLRRMILPALIRPVLLAAGLAGPTALWASPVPVVTPSSPPVWSGMGGRPNEEFGTRVASAGDVNGDGFGDVVIGAPGWGTAGTMPGRVFVYLGSPTGLGAEPVWSMEGHQEYASLGDVVDGAGDVNGDGYADIIIGDRTWSGGHEPGRGRAIIVPGSPKGPHAKRTWELAGEAGGESFGLSVAAAGDVNGDGYDDVLVGSRTGTFLFLGRPGGIESRPAWTGPQRLQPAGAGDLNGDGYDDVALAGGPETPVYLGSAAGLATEPSWSGPGALMVAGGGDVNGDGFGDLLLGPESVSDTRVRLFTGSPQGLSQAPVWGAIEAGFRRNWFGLSGAVSGDVNRDGYADVLVGAPPGGPVYVYLGGPGNPSSAPDWVSAGQAARDFGWSVALVRDADGDGCSEVLAGAPRDKVGSIYPGRAYLFALGPAYPAPRIVHEAVWNAPLGAPAEFEALVTDATRSVAKVEILYRQIWDVEYGPPVLMSPAGGDLYRGTLMAEQIGNVGIVYIIRATDDYGLSAETIPVGLDVLYPGAAAFRVRVEPGGRGGAGRISFETRLPGPARVRVFDVQGRLVGTLLTEDSLPPGGHSVPLDRLGTAAGVLFYRVETADGTRSGRLVRLK